MASPTRPTVNIVNPPERSGSRNQHAAIAIVMMVAVTCGCAARRPRVADARNAYYAGNYDTAIETLAEIADRANVRDAVHLDLAISELAAGRFADAENRLRTLRDRFDIPAPAPVMATASMAADDNLIPFELSAEEQSLVRTLLAIASLSGDGVDAKSYTLQSVTHRQQMIAEEKISPPRDVAIVPYMRAIVRESNHHDYDDASRHYQTVAATMPTFSPIGDDIARADGGVHSRPGHGVLYVIAMVGRGPVLVETEAPTTTAALAIASSIWTSKTHADDDGDAAGLPNIASVKVPAVSIPPSNVAAVAITINGQHLGHSQIITDVAAIAEARLSDEMPTIMARAIVRRATKEATVAAATKAIGLSGNAASIMHFAAASSWAAIEHADIRCWSLLPREFQVFRVELPIGVYDFRWTPIDNGGRAVQSPGGDTVEIEDGRNAYQLVVAG